MKLAASLVLLAGSASAYTSPMTMKVKAGTAKVAGPVSYSGKSAALPFAKNGAPSTLDGSFIGDAGFDPVGFSAAPVATFFDKYSSPGDTMSDLAWLREAELMHGRIAQIAVLGFIWPAAFGTLPGNEIVGMDAYSNTSPLGALGDVPGVSIVQILAFMSFLEFRRVNFIRKEGASRMPGDLKWGQGDDRWNPFKFAYTPEQYAEKQLQEIKHSRLAMLGAIGLLLQNANSGVSVVDQLGAAISSPDYYAKAGYYFPEGI